MDGKKNTPEVVEGQRQTEEKFTIAEAFSWLCAPEGCNSSLHESTFNAERGVRAVGYLLCSLSDGGNGPVDGMIANGLGLALEKFARRVSFIAEQHRFLMENPHMERR